MKTANLILASGSPRRIEMMKQKGYNPVILPAEIEETLPFPMNGETSVMYLACRKALWTESALTDAQKESAPVIIAADTIVYKDRIIGKPADEKEAFETLSLLRNNWHYVITGVCLLQAGQPLRRLFYEKTKVYFRDYTEAELSSYVKTTEPYDKAGGYAIQGTFGQYVDHIEGDYENVIGFPWSRIEKELERF